MGKTRIHKEWALFKLNLLKRPSLKILNRWMTWRDNRGEMRADRAHTRDKDSLDDMKEQLDSCKRLNGI